MIRRLIVCCLSLLGWVHILAQAPGTDFSATPTSGCGPLSVQFKDLSTNNPTAWNWDFNNGQASNLQNPSATFNPGSYTITLIARNASGAVVMRKTGYITVYPSPNPNISSNITLGCAPANVQFTDQSTPGQGSIVSWTWTFGDGTTSNAQNPTHVYTQTGYYNVSLKVTNSGGCSSEGTIVNYMRVVDGIQPNFTYNQASASCTAPFIVNFLNQTAGPGKLTYNWTLGSGVTPANSTDTNPSNITYPSAGSYTVNLQVNSNLGCSGTLQKTVTFSNNTAVLNGPTTACVNTPTSFSDGSTPLPPSITWDFNDGTGANTKNPTKTFTSTGTYNVKLVNKYPTCADSTIVPVQVVNPPSASFTFAPSPAAACKPSLTVNFTDQSTPAPVKWSWDFGDGKTDTTQNPSHTYTTSGTFTVKLTITGAGGCTSTASQTVAQIVAPTVTIKDAGQLRACVDNQGTIRSIQPTAIVTSVVAVTGYSWTAIGSNEGSSTSATPTFTYSTAGNYTITVTVTTAGGCTSNTASSSVQIGTATTVSGTMNFPHTVCGNNLITFTSTATPADQFQWDFGDGHFSAPSKNDTVMYRYDTISPPDLMVNLTVISSGCPNSFSMPITILPGTPRFGYKVTCPTTVSFLDSSLLGAPPPTTATYSWTFGDGGTSTAQNPTHPYVAAGSYPVTLILNDVDNGCKDTLMKTISIGSVTPDFTFNQPSICHNQQVVLGSSSTVSPPLDKSFIASYAWQIDPRASASPGSLTANGAVDAFTILNDGDWAMSLIVTDINGCTYTSPTHYVQITGPFVTSISPLTPPGGGCKNAPTTFVPAVNPYLGDPGTDGGANPTPNPVPGSPIVKWQFDFGNGKDTTYTALPIKYSYPDTGTYTVNFTAIDADGCSDFQHTAVQITSPIANFSGPDSFYCPGVPLTFIDSSQGYSLTDTWDFGDGAPNPDPALPTHTFLAKAQPYNVTLTVTDKYNCTSTIIKPVRIVSPVAAFDISDTTAICAPLQAKFVAHGQFYDSLYWNFGDSSTSTLPTTSHFYNNYGIDTATLFVQGPGGCLDSASRRILLYNPYTSTTFNFGPPLQACDSISVAFNIIPPPYTSFTLTFGDNSSDISQNLTPVHEYRNPNNYAPSLTLLDSTGCIVNISGTVPVMVLGATPFFTPNIRSFCDSGTVVFSDYTFTNDGLANETYTFGDGSDTSQIPGTGTFNPSHFYNQPGTYPVVLQVTTDHCSESYTDTIRDYQTPHPTITVPDQLCAGFIVFQGGITATRVDSVGWQWTFSDGQTSQFQDPNVKLAPGDYTVILKATVPPIGCFDTTSAKIVVNTLPSITGPKTITTPIGIPVTLPFSYSPNVVSYSWTPATNLDCPTCPDPAATLIFSTTYNITVTDNHGCTASDTVLVNTICNDKNYFLPNTFSPNGDGTNDYFYPRGSSIYNIQSLSIFNRWGQMVFQRRNFPANASNMGWDGTFNGHPAPTDAYVYIVEVICENGQVVALHGNVTLIR